MARGQKQNEREEEASLLVNRRSYLALAGSAVAATIGSNTVQAQTATGYGQAGYGQITYGGAEPSSSNPTIESFSLSKSEELGEDRMVTVKWAVADPNDDLDVVEIVVDDGSLNMNFNVTDVTGGSASGWDIFQFPIGTTLSVNLRVTDADDNTTKDSKSVTL